MSVNPYDDLDPGQPSASLNPYDDQPAPVAATPSAQPAMRTDTVPAGVAAMLPLVRQLEGSGDDATSPSGAVGRYQVMPATAKQYGFDPDKLKNPTYNGYVAQTIIGDLYRKFNGDENAVLVGYNAGPGRAGRYLASGGDVSTLPAETQAYLAHAEQIAGGDPYAVLDPGSSSQAAPSTPPAAAANPYDALDPAKPTKPGIGAVAIQSLVRGAMAAGQSVAQLPTAFKDRPISTAPKDYTDQLLAEPLSKGWTKPDWWVANILHGAAESSPTLALGIAGGAAGGAATSETGPGAVVGAAVGGTAGFTIGGTIQELAPAYQAARAAGLTHDQAVDRAMKQAGIAGMTSGAMGAIPGVKFFGKTIDGAIRKPISEALAQLFIAQPAIGAVGQEAQGAATGHLPTAEELATGYAQNVGTGLGFTAVHAGGEAALGQAARLRSRETAAQEAPIPQTTALNEYAGAPPVNPFDIIDPVAPPQGADHTSYDLDAALDSLATEANAIPERSPLRDALEMATSPSSLLTTEYRGRGRVPSARGEAAVGWAAENERPDIVRAIVSRAREGVMEADARAAADPGNSGLIAVAAEFRKNAEAIENAAEPSTWTPEREAQFQAQMAEKLSPKVAETAATVAPDILQQAHHDVQEWQQAAPKDTTLFTAMKNLGGVALKDADGNATEGPDLQGALTDVKRPGLINNKSGLTPERMQEALAQNGWFGPAEGAGAGPDDLVNLIQREASGNKVYHPESDAPLQIARRDQLSHDMLAAGVGVKEDPVTAAVKLGAYRQEQLAAGHGDLEALRAQADDLGVTHQPTTTHDELLADVLERKAIQEEGSPEDADQYEHQIDQHLTPDDRAHLEALAGEGLEPEHGEARGAQELPEGWEFEPPTPDGYSEHGPGAGGGGEDAAAALSPEPELASERVNLADGSADQLLIPGGERSAQQAAAAREGALKPKTPQQDAGGMFAPKEPEQEGLQFARGDGEGSRSGAERVARGLEGTPAKDTPETTHLIAEVRGLIRKLAPSVDVRAFEHLNATRETGGAAEPVHGATWRTRMAEGVKNVIAWSLEAPDAIRTVRHEAVHALRQAGLFHGSEWSALAGASAEEGWGQRYDIDKRYPDLNPDQRTEEAVAERFADWRRGQFDSVPKIIRPLFKRMDLALRQVGAAARRLLGKDATASDVFSRVESGEVGARGAQGPEAKPQFARSPEPLAISGDAKDEIAKNPRLDRGLKVGPTAKFYRGENDEPGSGMATYGLGEYIAGGRSYASRFGDVREVGAGHLPENPVRFKTVNDWQIWLQQAEKAVGYKSALDRAAAYPNLADFIRGVVPDADGVQISTGKDAIFVRFDEASEADLSHQREGGEPQNEPKARSFLNKVLGQGGDAVGQKIVDTANRFAPDPLKDLTHAVRLGVSPMAVGSERAQAGAKDFANSMRAVRYEWGKVDDWLDKTFTREDRQKMWEAADEESVIRQQQKTPGPNEGLNRLDPEQRAAVEELQGRADKAFARAQALGMTQAEGLPSYVPRMVIEMTAEGARRLPGNGAGSGKEGRNLTTSSSQLKQRKYLTAAETEAAAKEGFGEGAMVVKDIRTLALATSKLEQAIGGRTILEKVKQVGQDTGIDTVNEGGTPDPSQYFTVDHPAFRVWRPKYIQDASGKTVAAKDQNGQTVMEAKPLYVSKEFEGPLRAVLTTPTGGVAKALMTLKGKMMGVIMYSPLIHNAVIWGKAIPADPKGVLTLQTYFKGNQVKNDPATMREAIMAGMDPIGRNHGSQADITGIASPPDIAPGQSWTAQLLAAVPNLFSREAGDAVKRAVDNVGDVWHNKFLWDRVADLQAGLYKSIRDSEIKKGLDPASAQKVAAHFANRYAGALPMESMSKAARTMANLMLFSRSFTLGNLAAYKDMVAGMPPDVQAQIARSGGQETLSRVQGETRRKAATMLIMDVALAHIGLILAAGAAHSIATAMGSNQPYQAPGDNEAGKENRFLIGYQKDGTAIYGRLPTGKVGEDLVNWVSQPMETLKAKLSPYARLMYEIAANDKGFGQKLYDPTDHTPVGEAKNLGRIGWAAAGSAMPSGAPEGLWNLITGKGDKATAAMQTALPLAGITVSKGAPGGPALGAYYAAKDRHDFEVQNAMPAIKTQIAGGDISGARAKMRELGMAPGLQNYYVRTTLNPHAKLSARDRSDFMRYASQEERADMQRAQAVQARNAQP